MKERYLEEETEADPLVVSDVSPLLRVDSLVNARMGHINTNPLPEGAGDGVGGVDPAVRVENVLGTEEILISPPAPVAVRVGHLRSEIQLPALLYRKDTAQGTQSPLHGY